MIVEETEAMLHLGENVKPENLFFPEYLLMADFEVDQHGKIPNTPWVGADLKTKLSLNTTRRRYVEVLNRRDWTTTILESRRQSFRLMATLNGDVLEIRAVQGSGPTQVFILYQSNPEAPAEDVGGNK